MLDFVKPLATYSDLVLAADDFQLLDSDDSACQAIDWVKELERNQRAAIEELEMCQRTSSQALLQAARCLRENVRSKGPTIPVVCCPNYGPAAWKIIQNLVMNGRGGGWKGTSALITPSKVRFVNQVIDSCANQLTKRGFRPIHWHEELTGEEELTQILECLGLGECSIDGNAAWCLPSEDLDNFSSCVCDRITRFSELRGIESIPKYVAAMHVDKLVHERRSYSPCSSKQIATTVHGAKNREFDNVFILWPYQVKGGPERQRRLLYNGITRSKKNCMVLVQGEVERATNDPVLSLLGPAQPAFPKNEKSKSSSAKKVKRQ
jgi:hypothetical protein